MPVNNFLLIHNTKMETKIVFEGWRNGHITGLNPANALQMIQHCIISAQ